MVQKIIIGFFVLIFVGCTFKDTKEITVIYKNTPIENVKIEYFGLKTTSDSKSTYPPKLITILVGYTNKKGKISLSKKPIRSTKIVFEDIYSDGIYIFTKQGLDSHFYSFEELPNIIELNKKQSLSLEMKKINIFKKQFEINYIKRDNE